MFEAPKEDVEWELDMPTLVDNIELVHYVNLEWWSTFLGWGYEDVQGSWSVEYLLKRHF